MEQIPIRTLNQDTAVTGAIPVPTTAAEPGADAGRLLSALRDEERW